MRILGIDPGYATVGYGIIENDNGKLRPIGYGAIETPTSLSTAERLILIEKRTTELVLDVTPDEIAIEELFFNTNITTGIKVAQARGVILLSCAKLCGALYEYTPLQIKSTVTGNGTANKTQVQVMRLPRKELSAGSNKRQYKNASMSIDAFFVAEIKNLSS